MIKHLWAEPDKCTANCSYVCIQWTCQSKPSELFQHYPADSLKSLTRKDQH